MIIQTMMILITNFENYRLLKLVEQAKKEEKQNAITYAHRSTYVNPGALRSGEKPLNFVFNLIPNNFCPV